MTETQINHETVVNIGDIMKIIPHRYPFLLVDRVINLIPDKSVIAIKNVSINEEFFQGHFPSKPVMPGVLIIESMAQSAAVLVSKTLGIDAQGKIVYFMTIDNTRFRSPVVPGDQLKLEVYKVRQRKNVWKFDGKAFVDRVLVAEGSFSAMIVDLV
ncbi:MAG: 3-hydroxyacyl-[acyl-carrier-protein] dehydratase FabZ [Alphaproteobacteria bacterium TMED87]|nr:3-hydroxyacyl-[acyl-carrier-protein] dehydratase FabZ [Rhodospirillaceae bacterium]OUV09609.1 MAG: 3-hydroxyacyl-[acyl-carrier-protein] dehydratase FabZ [Alphaproteobacteria bacterium TMED87]